MGPGVVERITDLRGVIEDLAGARDDVGVLSIAVGIEPGVSTGGTPAWEIRLHNDLARLSHDTAFARPLERRLAEAGEEMQRLVDPAQSGRGRALYLQLGSGAMVEVAVHERLPTGARIGPVAHLLPLLGVAERGEPAAFLVASRDVISVSEFELGAVRDVERLELEPWVGDWWPEMKGAARANPLRGQQTVSHRDRYARRVEAAYRHTVDDAAERIASLARTRRWTRAVIAGDARRADALAEVLRRSGASATVLGVGLEGARPDTAVARLRGALDEMVAAQELEWAHEATSRAAARAAGACGLAPVLAALAAGRVLRLLIDPSRSFPGAVGPGETLSAEPEPGQATDLTDWIVVAALATGAAVTPVSGEAAAVLDECCGIGALLRW